MELTLDHLIIRAADPQATLDELATQAGAPILEPAQPIGPFVSGIVRAGTIDIEVLKIGKDPPPHPLGYGLGFTADVSLEEAAKALRQSGYAVSAPARATAHGRSWRAIQVRGLLPDPFPVPASTKPPGMLAAVGNLVAKVPGVARRATRDPGRSMVVVTEYEFDVEAWRAKAGHGPDVIEVGVGIGDHDWARLPLGDTVLQLDHDRPPGLRDITFEGDGEPFTLGDVAFEFTWAA